MRGAPKHWCVLAVVAAASGLAAQTPVANMDQAWDELLEDAIPAPRSETPVRPSPPKTKSEDGDFLEHFYFESRSDYWRYSSSFTGLPTVTGVINAPFTGVFNPNGIPYPEAFQPVANRVYSFLSGGTNGWLSDRLETHFTVRHQQDLSHVNDGAQAQNMVETFPGSREWDVLNAWAEIRGKPSDGIWAGTSLTVGRQDVYGAEMLVLDGASFTLEREHYSVTLFGGRRATFFSDPAQRAVGGANLLLRVGPGTSLEYSGLWYVKGSQRLELRKRLAAQWLLRADLRSYGGSPISSGADGLYTSHNGGTTLRLSFFEELTNKAYPYDFTYAAQNLDPHNPLVRLNLGTIPPYSQFAVEASRAVGRRLRAGGSVWIRRLNNENAQTGFLTSFQDYQANAQIFPLARTELVFGYHQRDSDRLSPATTTMFADIATSGETSVKDVTADLRRSFAEGRLTLSGGVYYRRISLQDPYFLMSGIHQSGWLAGASWRVDRATRLYFDYSLDNDFFLFYPNLSNSRALRVGVDWKYR